MSSIEYKLRKNILIRKLVSKYKRIFDYIDPTKLALVDASGAEKQRWLGKIVKIDDLNRLFFDPQYKDHTFYIVMNRDALLNKANGDMKVYGNLRKLVVFHELCHIRYDDPTKLRKHNVEDFMEVIKKFGLVLWESDSKKVPNILSKKHGVK